MLSIVNTYSVQKPKGEDSFRCSLYRNRFSYATKRPADGSVLYEAWSGGASYRLSSQVGVRS